MYEGCKTWWADPTDLVRRSLRVIEHGAEHGPDDQICPSSPWGYHVGCFTFDGTFAIEWSTPDGFHSASYRGEFDVAEDEDRWPTRCDFCDHELGTTFEPQRFTDVHRLYQRADNGEYVELLGPNGEGGLGPPGMLTHSDWSTPWQPWTDRYGDGINLLAVCPNGAIWHVDGAAFNDGQVTMPNAWSRTGDPKAGSLVVTPSMAGDYHGFIGQGCPPGEFSAG